MTSRRRTRATSTASPAAGITTGCSPGQFCPTGPVTREQMASFLARACNLAATGIDFFVDDEGSLHEADINRLAAAGITRGCSDGLFCPTDAGHPRADGRLPPPGHVP